MESKWGLRGVGPQKGVRHSERENGRIVKKENEKGLTLRGRKGLYKIRYRF